MAYKFAEDYIFLKGHKFEDINEFEPAEGCPALDRLRTDFSQIIEDKSALKSELEKIVVNQERATALLKKFGKC